MTRCTAKLRMLCGVAALVPAAPAFAQESEDGATGTVDIVVTARRTEERLQDVPISITVYDQEQLNRRNIVVGSDLATYTPSLAVNQRYGPERATFSLRGFNQDSYTSPTVGVYFNDVTTIRFQGGTTSGSTVPAGSFMDLQNVQVLKGPQGTLFGRNTTGGAILLVPRKPTDQLGGWIAGEVGNYDLKRGQGVLNVPLSDTVKVRLGIDRYKRDGYMRNRSGIGPDDFNDVDYLYLRAGLLIDLTPDLENYTLFTYSRSRTHGLAGRVVGCDTVAPTAENFTAYLTTQGGCDQLDRQAARGDGPLDVEVNHPNPYLHLTNWQVINTTTWKASDELTVKNIASYGQFKERTGFSLYSTNFFVPAPFPPTGAPFQIGAFDTTPGHYSTSQQAFTEELQLQGRSFDNRLTWTLGGYVEISDPLGDYQESYNNYFGECSDIGAQVCATPLGFAQLIGSRSKFKFRNTGIFAQGTFQFTDQLSLTGGLRYTWNKVQGFDESRSILLLPAGGPVITCFDTLKFPTLVNPTPGQCHSEVVEKSSAPTWLVDLDYKPTPDVLLYAKYSRGYREGGLDFISPGTEIWRPEKVDAYEVGAKFTLRGPVRGYFNVAGFYNHFTNQQISGALIAKPNSGQVGGLAIINAGTSRIEGIEVEASILPIDNLRVDLGYTYLKTKVTAITPPVLPPDSPFLEVLPSSTVGDPLTLSPKNRVTVSATYTLPVREEVGKVSFGATFTHTDKQVAGVGTDGSFGILPATDLLNLNLDWNKVAGGPLDLSIFATNVTNRKYPVNSAGSFAAFGFATLFYGQPQMYGVRVRFNFGQ